MESSIKESLKKAYLEGYEQALRDNGIRSRKEFWMICDAAEVFAETSIDPSIPYATEADGTRRKI